jgi:cytochrome P450
LASRKRGASHLLPYAATVFNMFGPDNALCRTALSAGFDTTVHGIGAAMRCLALNPDGAMARAFASLEPDSEPTPLFNNTLRGWVRMPVRARAA